MYIPGFDVSGLLIVGLALLLRMHKSAELNEPMTILLCGHNGIGFP